MYGQNEGPVRLTVSGKVIDAGSVPVSYAHILVTGRNEGTVGDYYGNFGIAVLPGDTLVISAVSFHKALVPIPAGFNTSGYQFEITLVRDTVNLEEVVIHPWPSSYSKFKQEFLEKEIEDPLANLNLHLPSPQELKALSYTSGEPGKIRLYAGSGPVSMIYDAFGKEPRREKNHARVMQEEKAYSRYNREVVRKVTGMTDEEKIKKFIEFCSLDIKFILESSEYELYAAILDCYRDFTGQPGNTGGDE